MTLRTEILCLGSWMIEGHDQIRAYLFASEACALLNCSDLPPTICPDCEAYILDHPDEFAAEVRSAKYARAIEARA